MNCLFWFGSNHNTTITNLGYFAIVWIEFSSTEVDVAQIVPKPQISTREITRVLDRTPSGLTRTQDTGHRPCCKVKGANTDFG